MKDNSGNSQSPGGANVVGFPPLIGLALAVVGILLHTNWPADLLANYSASLIIGIVVLAVGIGLQVRCIRALKQVKTTPLFDKPTSAIVKDGPYGRSRNPIYVAVLLQFIGLTFIVNSTWFLAVLLLLTYYLHFLVIKREEQYLEQKFGHSYLDYKAKVPRWL